MKQRLPTIILVLVFVIGLSLVLYPTIANLWNVSIQSRAIADYDAQISDKTPEDFSREIQAAREYNEYLMTKADKYAMDEAEKEWYMSLVNLTGNGMMGHIEIPTLRLNQALYHGTTEDVLQVAIGHIEGTSLPVGGPGTHVAISGHRGLPSARLFTDLDKLTEGDVFLLHVLGETFAYQIDQILIVDPSDVQALEIEAGKDYCTLVTCTPYGVNSHRLLLRGERVDYTQTLELMINVQANATKLDTLVVAPIIAAPLLLAMLIFLLIRYRKKDGK
ncbi:class C sortase [Eubacteriales bacterium OttesenSCG-928-K08]|nr:class C sortase [Eubacteriales bacterium OttesenSCG-928-K08]